MIAQTPSSAVSAEGQDRRKFTSRKVVGLSGGLDPADDDLGVWIERYLDLAVRGVRSPEVSAKISRHLERLRAWIIAGLGHQRVSAITPANSPAGAITCPPPDGGEKTAARPPWRR
ncbi:hypothetical protein GCM10022419_130540 [Nonomuraea rosea]|uniref:Core-binding (CB) domain-containing protein n=1 Tax=Nonomuraea rosea TaxID=638574 RepID=A0ABP7A046_9ACTN